jgi:hypothetical protein
MPRAVVLYGKMVNVGAAAQIAAYSAGGGIGWQVRDSSWQ